YSSGAVAVESAGAVRLGARSTAVASSVRSAGSTEPHPASAKPARAKPARARVDSNAVLVRWLVFMARHACSPHASNDDAATRAFRERPRRAWAAQSDGPPGSSSAQAWAARGGIAWARS